MVTLRLFSVAQLTLAFVAVVIFAEVDVGNESNFEYPTFDENYPDGHPIDYLDYSYHDYDLYYFPPDLSNATLRKCLCPINYIRNGSHCQEQITHVAYRDSHTHYLYLVNTSDFGSASIGEVKCSNGRFSFELSSYKDKGKNADSFAILETGQLYWNHYIIDDYCVEHIFDDEGNGDEWLANVCLDQQPIPHCCPQNHVLKDDGTCTLASTDLNFWPPIRPAVDSRIEVWPPENYMDIKEVNVTCEGSAEAYYVELDMKSNMLLYHPSEPYLLWHSPAKVNKKELRLDYCVGVKNGTEKAPVYIAKVCYKDAEKAHDEVCTNRTCVRKCCDFLQVLETSNCVDIANDSELAIFEPIFHHSNLSTSDKGPVDLTIVHGVPLCEEFFRLEAHKTEDDKFYLLSNGYLHAPSFPNKFSPKHYCLDYFLGDDHQYHILPLVCFDAIQEDSQVCKTVQTYLYPILLLASVLFLTMTLLVYIMIPDLHAKLHGKCLVSHISALLSAYVSLFIVQRTSLSLSPLACKLMASVTHVSFLAAFFWLNVMCFDIWYTLKSMRPAAETGERSRLKFKVYSVYSWGCPLAISIAANIIQNLPEEFDNLIRPGFGTDRCWFDDRKSRWTYFYGFVLILVIANIVFFCQVAYILVVAQNDPILQRTRQQNRERMRLYVKLFFVMGITWLAEVISREERTCELWIITDIINSLQGLSIFVIFVCKRNLLKKVRAKWEPYLRRVKEVMGSKKVPFSSSKNGTSAREQLSFSSSMNRPNVSGASLRTLQSQLSIDPSTVSRKISTSSLCSLAGVQVHKQDSSPMHTISEVTPERSNSRSNHLAEANSNKRLSSVPEVISLSEHLPESVTSESGPDVIESAAISEPSTNSPTDKESEKSKAEDNEENSNPDPSDDSDSHKLPLDQSQEVTDDEKSHNENSNHNDDSENHKETDDDSSNVQDNKSNIDSVNSDENSSCYVNPCMSDEPHSEDELPNVNKSKELNESKDSFSDDSESKDTGNVKRERRTGVVSQNSLPIDLSQTNDKDSDDRNILKHSLGHENLAFTGEEDDDDEPIHV